MGARNRIFGALAALTLAILAVPVSSLLASAQGYQVTVTCTVPKLHPERQLAPNSCLNSVRDGTQTYVAHVKDASGAAVAGVSVKWTDSDDKDARFRLAQNPCTTGSNGACSAELADAHPHAGEQITVTANADGSTAQGYLTFR